MKCREMPGSSHSFVLGVVLTMANIVGHSKNSRANRPSQRVSEDFDVCLEVAWLLICDLWQACLLELSAELFGRQRRNLTRIVLANKGCGLRIKRIATGQEGY
jgi:hypothetical protein